VLDNLFQEIRERAGLRNLRLYDLRHTFGSRLSAAGVSPFVIKDLMGHASITSTQRYIHHNLADYEKATRKLEGSDRILSEFTGKEVEGITVLDAEIVDTVVPGEGLEPSRRLLLKGF